MADIELLDAVHDMRATALSVANSLDGISSLLHEVGMGKIAARLDAAADRLADASSRLNNAYGEDLSERVNSSRDMAGQLLLLALKAATEKAGA
jgi:hypothetical protein